MTSHVKAMFAARPAELGIMAAVTGSLFLSFDSVFIRLSGISGFDTAFLFGIFSAISMSLFIQTTDPRGLVVTLKESGWPAVVSGLLIVGSALSVILSIKHTAVANTMVILSGRPVMTALACWLILKEKPTTSLWLAITGVIIGISTVASGSLQSGTILGDLFAFSAVIFLALNGTLWRRYKNISRIVIVGLGGFFLALTMSIPAEPSTYSADTWITMAAMGLFSAPLGRVLNATATRYIPAAEAAMIGLSSVILASLWAYLFFNEIPSLNTIIGGIIVISTITTYIMIKRRQN